MTTQSRKTILLATDLQNSVLHALDANRAHAIAYSPYGHRPLNGLLSLLGFNGELMDPLTGHYHLGNGYRPFSPVLMRFICPDSLSPFGKGGVNTYAYCGGDPRNRVDPTGSVFKEIFTFFRGKPNIKTTLTDLDEYSFGEISKYLSSTDMNNLRLVSKETKNIIDNVSNHNFEKHLNQYSPNIYGNKPATTLDKVIEVGLGRIAGISSSEANKTISVNFAKKLFDTHASPGYSYMPTSRITNKTIIFTHTALSKITRRHSYTPTSTSSNSAEGIRSNIERSQGVRRKSI